MIRRLHLVAGLVALALCPAIPAHDARPVAIVIDESSPHAYSVHLRVPPTVERDNLPALQLPEGCAAAGGPQVSAAVPAGQSLFVRCQAGLDGASLRLHWPLYNPSLTSVLQFGPQGHPRRVAVFAPEATTLAVPRTPGAGAVTLEYLRQGIRHIWSGIDHLLFVAGLLLLARSPRRILLGITGFTLAHSITLSLAALGILSPPVDATEAAIALSIVFLARELVIGQRDTLAWRQPVIVATCFGLLHGLGFAAALQEGGLPAEHVTLALLGFNVGVELGQLAFILAVLGLLRGVSFLRPRSLPGWATATTIGGYGIGVPALYWLIQRMDWVAVR